MQTVEIDEGSSRNTDRCSPGTLNTFPWEPGALSPFGWEKCCLRNVTFPTSFREPSCYSSHATRYLACCWNKNRFLLWRLRTYGRVRIYVGKMSEYCFSHGGNCMIFIVGWEFLIYDVCWFLPFSSMPALGALVELSKKLKYPIVWARHYLYF